MSSPYERRSAQLECPPSWRPAVVAALGAAGVEVDPGAPVGVAVTSGREVSARVDSWSVDSLPHLLVAVQPGHVEVGPWVVPGTGPCARCVAAAVLDERGRVRHGGPPLPLLALAAGSVARDLDAWARSRTPATWLTSWRNDDAPVPDARRWERHPYCGCGWFAEA